MATVTLRHTLIVRGHPAKDTEKDVYGDLRAEERSPEMRTEKWPSEPTTGRHLKNLISEPRA